MSVLREQLYLKKKKITKRYRDFSENTLYKYTYRMTVGRAERKNRSVKKDKELLLFDPSLFTKNAGDEIIMHYAALALRDIFDIGKALRVTTQRVPEKDVLRQLPEYKRKIVCGTNLISPEQESSPMWRMPRDLAGYEDVVTLGVGMEKYTDSVSRYSKYVFRKVLSKDRLHSVRDSYTEEWFRKMGIKNVINTGCPTLWNLTPEHCAKIPREKASAVIATITDYRRDEKNDRRMLDVLKKNYDRVYLWVQGARDEEYLEELGAADGIVKVSRELSAFREVLLQGDIDYVGTRLHAGIFAMNHFVRSVIIAVDNRALEMGGDFGLPVIRRENIAEELAKKINSGFSAELNIPFENIEKWKEQWRTSERG